MAAKSVTAAQVPTQDFDGDVALDLDMHGLDNHVLAAQPSWSAEQAARIVAALQESGLSVQWFAQHLGCGPWRLYKLRRLLAVEAPLQASPDKAPAPRGCVPLTVAFPCTLSPLPKAAALEIRHPSGLRIRFSHPPPDSFYQHLMQFLVPLC